MAKEKGQVTPETPRDTLLHASPWHTGKHGDKADRLHVPGEGFYLSKHAKYDLERDAATMAKAHGDNRSTFDLYHQLFISEDQIEAWWRQIEVQRKLQQHADERVAAQKAYEATCYPGTDTEDPTKCTNKIHDKRNEFDLDRSRSAASLTICSGHRYLNGSAVPHQHYVRMSFDSPDGRDLLTVCMTFDQFASFLVSHSSTPCTYDDYWSLNDNCVRLTEVVKEPESINSRMSQRLNDRLDEMRKQVTDLQRQLDEQIASGKAMSKTRLAEIRKALDVFTSHFDSNRDFTIRQAQEEVSSIVEQAAATIAWQHRLSPEELIGNSHVRALVGSWLEARKMLPAPDDSKEPTEISDK
jgi:hypothetical protein